MNLDKLFNPSGVAVVGASADKSKLGYLLMKNLMAGKKSRKIFPVNLNEKKILGLPCVASVAEIKAKVDLALVAVPAKFVAPVIEDCGKKNIPFVTIITAGFKEAGSEGVKRENEVKAIAEKYGIKIIGPNCLGIMDTASDFNGSFGGDLPIKGGLAFISQSGAVGTATLDWTESQRIGFSKFISMGNEAGVTENDFLEYLSNDKNTTAILMYLEAVTDGKRFIELAKRITPKKPIVVLKAGKTARGLKAVSSHTGSLAPSAKIFAAACREAGIISVDSLEEMFHLTKMFQAGIKSPGNRVAILTNGGGPSIVMSDLVESSEKLSLAEITPAAQTALRAVLPPTAAFTNPVDIIGDALSDRYDAALNILVKQKNIDVITVLLTPQKMTEISKTAALLSKYKKEKPIIAVFIGGDLMKPAHEIFKKNNIAYFLCPGQAVESLNLLTHGTKKEEKKGSGKKSAIQEVSLDFNASAKMLSKYGINLAGAFVESRELLTVKLKTIKYPAVMKVVSDEVLHKSDAGGVKVGIKNLAEAMQAWDDIKNNIKKNVPKAMIKGMVVQSMVLGREVIIGMKSDPVFGPVMVFGLGGIFVEILKDSSMRLAPVTLPEAKKMILEIKAAKILTGARGQKPVNIDALARLIVAVGKLATEHPEIKEIDLNPVMVNENAATVVDWRIIIDDGR